MSSMRMGEITHLESSTEEVSHDGVSAGRPAHISASSLHESCNRVSTTNATEHSCQLVAFQQSA